MRRSQVVLASRNLRDLGGIVTESGHTIARGRLYRSGELSDLDDHERQAIDEIGLTTIVDLRRDSEIERLPTPALGADTLHISPNRADSEFALVAAAIVEGRSSDINLEAFPDGYRQMAIDPYRIERYREVVRALIDATRHPVLVHCTAGKDRTGWSAALVLSIAGVGREAVMTEYLQTNEVRADHNAQRLAAARRARAESLGRAVEEVTDAEMDPVRMLLEVRAEYLGSAFAAIDETFPSFDAYRRDALGIDDERVEEFRRTILV